MSKSWPGSSRVGVNYQDRRWTLACAICGWVTTGPGTDPDQGELAATYRHHYRTKHAQEDQ